MMALDGTIVLDLCRGYPGARCAVFLADFGADVIRVDQPTGLSTALPLDDTVFAERMFAYSHTARNKKSIILNLKSEQGCQILYELVKTADVLLEGFRPGVTKKLKVDYETLQQINPRLIYCSLTGFGQDGPYASLPGHDMNYVGISGALSLIGPRDGAPCMPSNLLADAASAGLNGTIGILLALMAREKTGKGQFVDISYLDGVISLVDEAAYYFLAGIVPKRGETYLTGSAPYANVYRCKDGEYITLGCIEAPFWQKLCTILDREDLIPLQQAEGDEREMVFEALRDIFVTKTRDEWFEFFKANDIPGGPVYSVDETFKDPQVVHRKMVAELDHPKLGKVKQLNIPIRLSDTPGTIRSLGVVPGANTDEILQGLGYSQEKLAELREAKAIE